MQVPRCVAQLDDHLTAWVNRPLGAFSYIIADARYETVRYGGHAKELAIIWAICVTKEGQKEVLGMTVRLSEADWRDFFMSLSKRGLTGVEYIVSDSHKGLTNALKFVFPCISSQRCQFHLSQNPQAQLRYFIQKLEVSEPKLVAWADENTPQNFDVFSLSKKLHKSFRTSNLIECFNQELKRRSNLVRNFPNEESCLCLLSAVAFEFHED